MASLLKESRKAKGKRNADDMEIDQDHGPVMKKPRNKQRVLMLSSRGINHRMRHLMNDLEALLPHVKKDSKLDSKNHLHLLPELADLNNCNNTLYFEARRHEDLYMWAAKTPNGPSIKLHVQNIHTMDELKMTGNCLKGSRGILSFDKAFDESEWGKLTKEVFTHIFGVPPQARKAKPFIDHVLTFSILDSKIFISVDYREGPVTAQRATPDVSHRDRAPVRPDSYSYLRGRIQRRDSILQPRCAPSPFPLHCVSMLMTTAVEFVTPAAVRSALKREKGDKYGNRKHAQAERGSRKDLRRLEEDELAVSKVFT